MLNFINRHTVFYLIFVVSFFVYPSKNLGQDIPVKNNYSVSANLYTGLITRFNSYNDSNLFITYRPVIYELTCNKISFGKKQWEKDWRFPVFGFALSYYDYNSTDSQMDLGKSIAFVPFLEMSVFRISKLDFTIAPGLGLGYHTKVFDFYSNYKNNAYSSHLSAGFLTDFKLRLALSKEVSIHGNFGIRHFSNGAVQLPNAGTNMLIYGAGITITPLGSKCSYARDSIKGYDKKFHLNIEMGYNKKGIRGADSINYIDDDYPKSIYRPGDSFKYSVFMIGAYLSRKVSKINSLLIGLDLYWDESTVDEYVYNRYDKYYLYKGEEVRKTGIDNFSIILNTGTEVTAGKVSYTPQIGFILYQYEYFYGRILHRHTIKYYIHPKFYFKGALKVFSFAADSFDLGIGIKI